MGSALSEARVDLNPHQVEAASFALNSLERGGCMLADEVGLGKTIEAGLVLAQLLAEGRSRLLILCPATLRAQWQSELREKFNTLVMDPIPMSPAEFDAFLKKEILLNTDLVKAAGIEPN